MKKSAALLSVFALALVLSIPFASFAMEDDNSPHPLPAKKIDQVIKKVEALDARLAKPLKIEDNERSVSMKANGEFRVSGVQVNSVNAAANTINVSFFGFTRDINVAGAKIIGGGQSITLADVKAGDELVGTGKFDAATKSLTVSQIHDLSFRKSVDQSAIMARINELLKMVEELKKKLGTQGPINPSNSNLPNGQQYQ